MTITIATSNVNGLRAANRKGVSSWVGAMAPDIWCMQEVRAPQVEIEPIFDDFAQRYAQSGKVSSPDALVRMNEVCKIKGRAGVGLLSDLPVVAQRYGLPGLEEDVDTGRWIEADVTTPQGYEITVASVYVHSGAADDALKMAQKFRFLDQMLVRMGELRDEAARGGRQAVLCGDFNIAHTPLDIKNAKANLKHAGFMPSERVYIDKWLDEYAFVDVMRNLAGDIQGPYTWWSQRGRAFDNNVGWRIDYQFATPELAETARGFVIDKAPSYATRWSDHAPLIVTYDV
ncbi:exodeoxyribonuclease III [Bifidobacterium subtile]|jgi:exodeoxyribonuclease-3|uniref:Exodeoxyribonuclease III n=1 Tax=Bifidobacterium subtile TaxID=77635 RepID=A0A087DU53_9BIFI|nr:exodeoxyribonuclease III [Bifidobacterium subtile]KFI99053.1 exodeoxyribonuclease III [Bifidobacterium subtile]MCI1222591.1 exodeoxyribonuclease III [Bifidobacterium subtile]MCI1240933.1 exodeoxyribonuclease III [Bifidobacterium subtile]MCI1258190.1 exodeoxyribonuclease III [Bifidobacterium subtile]QOL36930.1 endonuclease/exonuclease/phosphatase family protein [Bifidobacterium subtile]